MREVQKIDYEEREMTFQEAERLYSEWRRQLDSGNISEEEFNEQRKRLMVQDDQGRWWAISRRNGGWMYQEGGTWVPGTPPGPRPGEQNYPQENYGVQTKHSSGPGTLSGDPVKDSKPVSGGLAILFYVLAFLFPIVGFILFLVYRIKPLESDRSMAKKIGIWSLVGVVLYLIISV